MCNIKELQKFVEKQWESDFDIEIKCSEMPTKIAIFSEDRYLNFWRNNSSKCDFNKYRLFIFPETKWYPKYKETVERFKKHKIEEFSVVDLETAKKIVELMFGSKKIKYKKIKEVLEKFEGKLEKVEKG